METKGYVKMEPNLQPNDSRNINIDYLTLGFPLTGQCQSIETRTSDPSPVSEGRIWLRTDL